MRIEKFKHISDNNTNDDISDLNLTLYKISKTARFLGHIEAADILNMAMVVLEDEENLKKKKIKELQSS